MSYFGTILFLTLVYKGKGEVHSLFRPWHIKARDMSYFRTILFSTLAYKGKGEVHSLFSTLAYKGKGDVLLWNHTILDFCV